MRPVVQKAVVRVSSQIMQQGLITWEEIMQRFSELGWRLSEPPFEAVLVSKGRC